MKLIILFTIIGTAMSVDSVAPYPGLISRAGFGVGPKAQVQYSKGGQIVMPQIAASQKVVASPQEIAVSQKVIAPPQQKVILPQQKTVGQPQLETSPPQQITPPQEIAVSQKVIAPPHQKIILPQQKTVGQPQLETSSPQQKVILPASILNSGQPTKLKSPLVFNAHSF